ncbi:MAG: AMP-dependent synthetase [Betaproteobacteria bacterium]|nr:AMP-dependent synthetase [Betaproteobacteria bacterium]
MTDSRYYDALETRDPAVREAALMAALPGLVAHAKARSPGFAKILHDIDPTAVTSRAALAKLPVTRKSDLKALQSAMKPFGGLTTMMPGQLAKIFMSPGPIYDPEARRADYWRSARALYACGIRAGDLLHNTFSYHLTPAGSMLEAGALQLGCAVIPAGTGNTEQQIEAITDLQPTAYVGTAAFLRILVEKFIELKIPFPIKRAITGGDALPLALRNWLKEQGLANVLQFYGSADLGNIAYESEALEGMILDEELILEIVRPGSGDPVAPGEVGEIVVTTLNPEYPLIRFATGDLSGVLPGVSPCGRTNTRIKGWMGRADQTTKVKGMFVQPGHIDAVVKRHPEIIRARLVVEGEMANDRMSLKVEVADPGAAALADGIAATLRDVTKMRGDVQLVTPGTLPNDGKVIEDARKYD